jgi:hypothetical protein
MRIMFIFAHADAHMKILVIAASCSLTTLAAQGQDLRRRISTTNWVAICHRNHTGGVIQTRIRKAPGSRPDKKNRGRLQTFSLSQRIQVKTFREQFGNVCRHTLVAGRKPA